MHIAEKAKQIQTILDRLVPQPAIPLKHRDPYTLLIAVVLSARCTDAQVNRVTPVLFGRASTPQAMVQLSVAEIAEIVRPCGLSLRKARAIWELSQLLLEKHAGQVPAEARALESLPGVGHKSASVVLSQAFGQTAFPVDTHIHRCAARWGLSDGRSVTKTEADLKRCFPPSSWGKLHLQIIYFARAYCPARGHQPDLCPICAWAAKRDRPEKRSP